MTRRFCALELVLIGDGAVLDFGWLFRGWGLLRLLVLWDGLGWFWAGV